MEALALLAQEAGIKPLIHFVPWVRGTRKDIFFPQMVLAREDGLYIAGSLDFDPEVLSRLKRAALGLEASGELRRLRSRYLMPEEE